MILVPISFTSSHGCSRAPGPFLHTSYGPWLPLRAPKWPPAAYIQIPQKLSEQVTFTSRDFRTTQFLQFSSHRLSLGILLSKRDVFYKSAGGGKALLPSTIMRNGRFRCDSWTNQDGLRACVELERCACNCRYIYMFSA